MALNQPENQVSYPSQPSISEGQKVSLIEIKNQPTENTQTHTKWRWLWLGLTVIIMVTIVLLISLVFTQFGTLIGYPILISTISATLAGLLVVSIVETVTLFRKQNK